MNVEQMQRAGMRIKILCPICKKWVDPEMIMSHLNEKTDEVVKVCRSCYLTGALEDVSESQSS